MAKMKSPTLIAKRWADATSNNVARYKEGVAGVTESPTAKAAQAVDRYASGVQRAVQDGTFVDGCNSVSLSDWQKAASDKGAANMATGVRAAEPKMVKTLTTLLPHCQMVSDAVAQMPKGTLEDAKQRSNKAIELMAQYKKPR